jgi:hypothetical protein
MFRMEEGSNVWVWIGTRQIAMSVELWKDGALSDTRRV